MYKTWQLTQLVRNHCTAYRIFCLHFVKHPPEVLWRCSEVVLWQSLFFNNVAGVAFNFAKKRLWQWFSCEFCEISKNAFFTEHLQGTQTAFCGAKLVSASYDYNSKGYSYDWKKITRQSSLSLFSVYSFFFFYFWVSIFCLV